MVSQKQVDEAANRAIEIIARFCAENGLGPQAVISILFAAAGAFGWRLGDKRPLMDELRKFVKTTRAIHPQFTLEGDEDYGAYLQYLKQSALAEKQNATVH